MKQYFIKTKFNYNLHYILHIGTELIIAIKLIAQLLTATWHQEHEDLINTVYLHNLNNNIFTDSLYKIATEPGIYKKYDDEMESTLRKCIHALKMINSGEANTYLEELKNSKSSNVDMALSVYNK
ncbi:hypothetical protein ACVW2L_003282 [Mucilaginibacter sp. HD30]